LGEAEYFVHCSLFAQKLEDKTKKIMINKTHAEGQKVELENTIGNFLNFASTSDFPDSTSVSDPDPQKFGSPGSAYRSVLGMRIRIQEHGN
jgi:hypothetical protein